jgi:TPR repeat protein
VHTSPFAVEPAPESLKTITRRLAATSPGSTEHTTALAALESLAEANSEVDVWWNLAAYYLQVRSHPEADARAIYWLKRCADTGFGPAIDRLALRAFERGDGTLGASYLEQLALHGYAKSAWELAYALAASEQFERAADWLLRACALACPPAYFSLGWRLSFGLGLPTNAALGQALIRRAADGRYPAASAFAEQLPLSSSERAEADRWHTLLRANLAAAPLERLAPDRMNIGVPGADQAALALEKHFAALDLPGSAIGADGRLIWTGGAGPQRGPAREWSKRSDRPHVRVCSDFASVEECTWLIHRSAALLRRSRDYSFIAGANDLSEVENFTGSGSVIDTMKDDVVSTALQRRIADLTGWDMERIEPCSVIRYEPGEEYRPHVDYFTVEQINANERDRCDFGGQRIGTFLVCLEAPDSGGETLYEYVNLSVPWTRGMALWHDNVLPNGMIDLSTTHAGLPVLKGQKWLFRTTLREHVLAGHIRP